MRFLREERKWSDHTVQRQTLKRKAMGRKMQEQEDWHKEYMRQENSMSRKRSLTWVLRMITNDGWKEVSTARKGKLDSSNSDPQEPCLKHIL